MYLDYKKFYQIPVCVGLEKGSDTTCNMLNPLNGVI